MIPRSARACSGFTLIEVVLAIALSAVLLGLLTLAVDQYLVNVQSSRAAVEHAQVARGVLRMIGDDLRNAAIRYEQDIGTAEQLAAAAAEANFDADSVDEQTPEEEFASETEPRQPLGVSGDLTTLQIDVARTRRNAVLQPKEFAAANDNGSVFKGPPVAPGISTVRYSLAPQGGLARQEVARDVALFEEQQGVTASWDAAYRVVAEEVTAVEFRYRSDAEVLSAWNLEEFEGENPTAVEVRVTIREPSNRSSRDAREGAPTRTYRMSVPMPPIDRGVSSTDVDGQQGSAAGDAFGSAGSDSR